MNVPSQTLRLLQVLAGVNVVLAVAVCVVRILDGDPAAAIAAAVCYGLGFAALFVASTRELRADGRGRAWMAAGGLLLAGASVLFLLS